MDPDIQGGVDQERAEWIGRLKDNLIPLGTPCLCGAPHGEHPGICQECLMREMMEEPS